MKKVSNILRIILYVIVGFIYLLACTIVFASDWGITVFNVDIEATLFTLTNPMKGANNDVVGDALKYILPRVVIALVVYVVLVVIDYRKKNHLVVFGKIKRFKFKINLTQVFRSCVAIGCLGALWLSVCHADEYFGLFEYLETRRQASQIYEDYYINPNDVNIRLTDENGKKKNLIYVYLESMETSYTSYSNGGQQDTCYIPNLVNLANENISFSNNENIGGFFNTSGTGWTMGSLLATSSGIPYSFPTNGNTMGERETYASGLTNMGDILEDFGYNQYFLCGSDADFAGRKTYYQQHGNHEVIDLYSAREKGYIAEDYEVWWGFEDKVLYDIAKTELLEIAKNDEPFNFTMLTVDTHHSEGYFCELCENRYPSKTANIISCADRQVYNFVEWCKEQSFYEDTIIVITGDHPRMDTFLVEGLADNQRPIYNCFINCDTTKDYRLKNRTFTPMDIFPTVMSGLGFEWDGDRLGLGTNMFSTTETLAEELGFDYLNTELLKNSNYYLKNFN